MRTSTEINRLHISQGGAFTTRNINTNSSLIKTGQSYIIKHDEEKIVITIATISYLGVTHKAIRKSDSWKGFGIKADLPIGIFYFDMDESNEDTIVIYFNEN